MKRKCTIKCSIMCTEANIPFYAQRVTPLVFYTQFPRKNWQWKNSSCFLKEKEETFPDLPAAIFTMGPFSIRGKSGKFGKIGVDLIF